MSVQSKETPRSKNLTLRILISEAEQLEALARRNERSISAEVRRAIRAHLKAAA